MPTYEIYKKDGTPVKIEGPEGASTEELVELYLSRKKKFPSRSDIEKRTQAELEAIKMRTPLTLGEQLGEGFKGVAGGAAGLLESGALGLASVLPEKSEVPTRDFIQDIGSNVQESLAPDVRVGGISSAVPRKFGEALGSFGGILGTALIPWVGMPLAAGLATAAGAGEASERAREGGATQEERNKAARLGAIVGISELLPIERLKSLFVKGIGADNTVGLINRGRRVLEQAGWEGLQEFSAAVAQNFIEQGIYNPEQGTFAGTREPALYGAGVGGFVQLIADMIAPRRGARTDVTRTDDEGGRISTEDDPQGEELGTDREVADAVKKVTTTRLDSTGTVAGTDTSRKRKPDATLKSKYPGITPAAAKLVAEYEKSPPMTNMLVTPKIKRVMKANKIPVEPGMTVQEAMEALMQKSVDSVDAEVDTKEAKKETTKDTDLRKLNAEWARLKENQKLREERLNDPKKMEAYAEEKGISTEAMQELTETNYRNNQPRLEELNAYFNSEEGKARVKKADDRSKEAQERIKFKDTSPKTDAYGNIIDTKEEVDEKEAFAGIDAAYSGKKVDEEFDPLSEEVKVFPKKEGKDKSKREFPNITAAGEQFIKRVNREDQTPDQYFANLSDKLNTETELILKKNNIPVTKNMTVEDARDKLADKAGKEFVKLPPKFQRGFQPKDTQEANKKAKSVYKKNLETKYYLEKGQKPQDLDDFNKQTTIKGKSVLVELKDGTTLVVDDPTKGSALDADDLPVQDKNKIIALIESKPPRERGKFEGDPKEDLDADYPNMDFLVAQTLSKDPNIENVLDEVAYQMRFPEREAVLKKKPTDEDPTPLQRLAAIEKAKTKEIKKFEEKPRAVINPDVAPFNPAVDKDFDTYIAGLEAREQAGEKIFIYGKQKDVGGAYYRGMKKKIIPKEKDPKTGKTAPAYFLDNTGQEAALRVANWVENNLSPEGKAWFKDRVDLYNTDRRIGTKGQQGRVRRYQKKEEQNFKIDKKEEEAFKKQLIDPTTGKRYDEEISKDSGYFNPRTKKIEPITDKQRQAKERIDKLIASPYSEIKKYDAYDDRPQLDIIGRELKKEQAWKKSVETARIFLEKTLADRSSRDLLSTTSLLGGLVFNESDLNDAAKDLYYFRYKAEYLGLKTKEERDLQRQAEEKYSDAARKRKAEERFVKKEKLKRKEKKLSPEQAVAYAMYLARKKGLFRKKEVDIKKGVDTEFKLPKDAVIDLEYPLSTIAIDHLGNNRLFEALKVLGLDTNNKVIARIANKFADLVGTTEVFIVKNLKVDGKATAGVFNPKTNTIKLDAEYGMTPHVLLHEMTHALASAELANPSSMVRNQLNTIFKSVRERLDTAYGTQDLDEFVSEALSNPKFQQKLARIPSPINIKGENISWWQRFMTSIANFIRRKTGYPEVKLDALSVVNDLAESLLAPAPEYRNASMLGFGPKSMSKFIKRTIGKAQKDKTYLNEEQKDTFIDSVIENLGNRGVGGFVKDALQGLGDLLTITTIGDKVGFNGLGHKLNVAVQRLRGKTEIAGRDFDDIMKKIKPWFTNPKNKDQVALLDDIIYNLENGATIYQVDPDQGKLSDYVNKDGTDKIDKKTNVNYREKWEQCREKWKKLSPEGKQVYRNMRDHYKKQFSRLEQVLYSQIDADLKKDDPVGADKLKKTVFEKIFSSKALNVYFPLIREGNYLVKYSLKDPVKPDDNLVAVTFNSERAAERHVKDMIANDEVVTDSIEMYDTMDKAVAGYIQAPPTGFVANVLDIVKDKDMKQEIVRMFINTLPETSYAKFLQKRANRVGFNPDSLKAFKEKGFSLSRQVVQLEVGREIRDIEKEIVKVIGTTSNLAKEKRDTFLKKLGIGMPTLRRVGAEMLRRAKFARLGAKNKDMEKVAKAANQTAFIYTIGANISSALVNLSQIPLFVYPYVGAEYGLGRAFGAIKKANSIVTNGFNNDLISYFDINENGDYIVKDQIKILGGRIRKISSEEKQALKAYIPLIKEADERGQLTKSWIMDALGLGETGRDASLTDKVAGVSAAMFNYAERYNRQTTLLATYELALRNIVDPNNTMEFTRNNGKYSFSELSESASAAQKEEAVNKALRQTQETNGGTVLETAPRWAQQGIGRVAFMYKSYGLRMYTTMLQSARELLRTDKTLTNEDRKLAFKQLVAVHLSAVAFAGIQGLPLYGALSVIADMFLDDEEDDADTLVRKYVGEEWYKGLLNLITGLDFASRVRLTGLLVQENRFNKDATLEENVFFYLGGPAFSTFDRIVLRGINQDLRNGELERAVENILPPAVANAWKGTFGRVAREGYKTRRGDLIYGDLTLLEEAGVASGLGPVGYATKMERNNRLKDIDKNINTRRTKLLKKLYLSMSTGNLHMYYEAMSEISKFNNRHPLAPISSDSVKRSMQRHRETTKDMEEFGGVTFSSTNIDLLRMNREQYDSDYRFF